MSGPAIIAVIGMGMGAKTAIEGIKEGNIAKAVMGGVGAYLGATGLSNIAAGSAGATEALGTEAAAAAATEATAGAATDAAATAATDAAAAGTIPAEGLAPTQLASFGKVAPGALPASSVGEGITASAPAAGPGFLSKAGDWLNKNQTLGYGLMQIGGQALSGYSAAEMQEKQAEELRKQEDAKRARIGYQPEVGFLKRYEYNPATAAWSPRNGTA
jgi:hypothetical protein